MAEMKCLSVRHNGLNIDIEQGEKTTIIEIKGMRICEILNENLGAFMLDTMAIINRYQVKNSKGV